MVINVYNFLHAAKNQAARSPESDINGADAVQENQAGRVREDREEPNSSNKEVLPGSGECSSPQNNERDQSKPEDFDGEQLGGVNVPSENQNNGTHHSESLDCDVEGSEGSHERDQSKSEDFDGKQLGGMNVESEIQNNGTRCSESSDCDVEGSEASHEMDQNKSVDFDGEQLRAMNIPSEEQNNGTHHNESSDCDVEGSETSNEVFSPTEFVDNKNEFALNENDELVNSENGGFASNGNEEVAVNENKELADNEIKECEANGNEELAHSEVEEFAHNESEEFAHNENEEFSQEFAHNGSDEFAHKENAEFTGEFSSNGNEELSQKQNHEFAQNQNEKFAYTVIESLALARADLEVPVDDKSSPLAEANSVDTSKKIDSDSNVRSSNVVNSVATSGNGSSSTAHIPVRESIASDTLISPPSEHCNQPRKSVYQGFGRLRSEEFIPSSELSGSLGEMSKSPTRGFHAYDGSISSYDGMDDQLPHRHLHSLENTYKAANFLHSEERLRRGKYPARMATHRDSEMQHQARPSWSDKKNHSMKNSKWDRDEFLQPARHERTVQNWRLERHEHHQPSSAFHRMSSRASYENSRPSSQLHDEFNRRPSFQSYDRFEDPEQVKMKLLAMVLDQLNKNYPLHDKENEGIPGLCRKERYMPRYHTYEPRMEERFHPPNYPRYSGRYGSGSNSYHRRRFKKIPFSGEATSSSSHQFDPSCFHCCPSDWQRSVQLPSASRYYTSGRIHPGHNYSTCFSSCPSSPQWSMDSEYPPWGREKKSDDQCRRSQDMTNYLREKHRSAKRHFRPIAGGAPFLVCYKCFKLLQLPADFLLFKKKCHRLRCGACLEVLKFSLQKGSHIVRYEVSAVDPPPPSEAEDYGDDVERRNMASTSQHPHADPVSCSDDYELSYCKSCSTEDDPASNALFHTPRGSTVDKRNSQDSLDFTREFVPAESRGKNKSIYDFSGYPPNIPNSENLSSEIQELPPRSSSPLHRLMGYSSPRQVIFGSNPSGRGASTSYSMQREKRDKN